MKALLMAMLLIFGLVAEVAAKVPHTVSSEQSVYQLEQQPQAVERAPSSMEEAAIDESLHISAGCCKICTKGKACGNSCISRAYQCHKPKGCACDG